MFYVGESLYHEGYYLIRTQNALFKEYIKNEYPNNYFIGKLQAYLFGLSYPEYLKMARENYSALLLGGVGWIIPAFKSEKDCLQIVTELNNRWKNVKERSCL